MGEIRNMIQTVRLPVLMAAMVGFACMAGCSNGDKKTSEEAKTDEKAADVVAPTKTKAVPEKTEPVAQAPGVAMKACFWKAREAREHLIRGDIERAKAAIRTLAKTQPTKLPPERSENLNAMREAADRFIEAGKLIDAGQAMGDVLNQCGNCHRMMEVKPGFETVPLPEGDNHKQKMKRHQWASARMWEGLVGPSLKLFTAGLEEMKKAPLAPEGIADEKSDRAAKLSAHIERLQAQATDARNNEERASIFGRFLGTCYACHKLLDVEITPIPGITNSSAPMDADAN